MAEDCQNKITENLQNEVTEENVLGIAQETMELTRSQRWELHKKEKAEAKKAAKRAKREALEADYKDAPPILRVFRLYIMKPLFYVLGIGLVLFLVFVTLKHLGVPDAEDYISIEELLAHEVSKEQIYAECPADIDGERRIADIPGVQPEDTWTISIYMVGSNLEDYYRSELSQLNVYLTDNTAEWNQEKQAELSAAEITQYMSELNEKGMELPDYLYLRDTSVKSYDDDDDSWKKYMVNEEGSASIDIGEIKAAVLPENVSVIIQTGGTSYWSNVNVNPNKTQRFEVKNGRLREVDSMPLQDSCSTDTLVDFLRFSRDNYPSDHRILIFWDHGYGVFGYGYDDVFNTGFSLNDLNEALSNVWKADPSDPAYDLIGFDACLMATAETAHSLYGFGRYLAASEEVEPGEGWNYTSWLEKFAENTAVSGAQIGQYIADAYIDHYVRENICLESLSLEKAVTFSVIDLNGAEKAYQAYTALVEAQLKDAVTDYSVTTEIGRAAQRAVRYCDADSDVYNLSDLGGYADAIGDLYLEEVATLKKALSEAVLYSRGCGYLADSQGISTYIPVKIAGIEGLQKYLNYINRVTDSEAVKALYYYKFAGCLNDELQEYVTEKGWGEAKKMDVTPLKKLSGAEILTDGADYSVTLSQEASDLIQSYRMILVQKLPDSDDVVYMGSDNYAVMDGEGHLGTEYDGAWISLGGVNIAVEITDETDFSVRYRSHILYNDADSYLIFAWDKDAEEFTILGVRDMPGTSSFSGHAGDTADRAVNPLAPGDTIIPVYEVGSNTTESILPSYGPEIKYSADTKLEILPLDDGEYCSTIIVTDPRSDEYYTPVMSFTVSDGEIIDLKEAPEYAYSTDRTA